MIDSKNIWNDEGGGHKGLTEAQIKAYLEGKLSGPELREVEALFAGSSMESDALEGLQQLSVEESKKIERGLNQKLLKFLHKKKRKRRKPENLRWTLLAIILILFLALISFAVIYLIKQR